MDETILRMNGIVKVFAGVRALSGVQFELKRGEIHALIGENGAGKSTLMKILLGLYSADAGEIMLRGEKVHFKSPAEALRSGISMIHQEISLVPEMDVSENIWLGREKLFKSCGLLNKKKRVDETRKLLESLDIRIDPTKKINELSVANMQLVELARAVSYHSDIIIMDEPTSALTNKEIGLLYRIVRKLAKEGTAIIFISHKLEEIYEICQRVTVLRDGTFVATENSEDLPMERLISMIVGRKQNRVFEKANYSTDEVILEVKDLCKEGVFEHINFEVHKGEVDVYKRQTGYRVKLLRTVRIAGRTERLIRKRGISPKRSGSAFLRLRVTI